MEGINTLVKLTHGCNLRCKYCFHEKYGYQSEILSLEKLKQYLLLLNKNYKNINLVWHGGEPLMVPLDYYVEIYDFASRLDAKITYSLQTNGTLLNSQNIAFFKNHNTGIGLSFDGLKNQLTRGQTDIVIQNIEQLKVAGYNPGAILVANSENIENLIDEYEYFKKLNIGMKINPMFNDGAATNHSYLHLNPDQYVKNFVNFFIYWLYDKECNIRVSTCEELIDLVLNKHSNVCIYGSCLGKWLCLDSNGHLYPCDRLCTSEFDFGDVSLIGDIQDAFRSSAFYNLLLKSVEHREGCITSCEFYENCYSSCNANFILNNYNNGISCYIHKEILKKLKELILTVKKEDELNPTIIKKYRR